MFVREPMNDTGAGTILGRSADWYTTEMVRQRKRAIARYGPMRQMKFDAMCER